MYFDTSYLNCSWIHGALIHKINLKRGSNLLLPLPDKIEHQIIASPQSSLTWSFCFDYPNSLIKHNLPLRLVYLHIWGYHGIVSKFCELLAEQ